MHFIVYFIDKEKQTGIIKAIEEKLQIFAFTASKDGSNFISETMKEIHSLCC